MARETEARRPPAASLRAALMIIAVPALLVVPSGFVLAARGTPQAPVFRSGVDLVNLGVTVTDRKGRLVTGLKAGDFEVYEDGRKQAIRYFAVGDATGEARPEMHLGVLLDVSESMGEDVRFTRTAAIRFLNALTEPVDVTVVDFDIEVRAARYSQKEF